MLMRIAHQYSANTHFTELHSPVKKLKTPFISATVFYLIFYLCVLPAVMLTLLYK